VANRNSHNAAFVTGTVLGGLVGAAVALWKTPYSGEELRAMITGGEPGDRETQDISTRDRLPQPTLKDKVVSVAENVLAPVVGVELGKTANDSGATTPAAMPIRTEPATPEADGTGEPPAFPNSDEELIVEEPETGGQANVTPVDESSPGIDRSTPSTTPVPEGDAATIEELTTPQTHIVPDALKHQEYDKQPFPKLGGTEKS